MVENSDRVGIDFCDVGDDDNNDTVGIGSVRSIVTVDGINDYDGKKVATGLISVNGGILMHNDSVCGDNNTQEIAPSMIYP